MKVFRTGALENSVNDVELEDVIAYLDATKVKSYRLARASLEFAKLAVAQVGALGIVKEGTTPLITKEMREIVKNLAIHAEKIGNDSSRSDYPEWNDLRHWVVQAFSEYAKEKQGGDPALWNTVAETVDRINTEARSVFTRLKDETEKGMNLLQTVFVIGGLVAVGVVIKNWFVGEAGAPPSINMGLLPVPHVSVSQPVETPHHHYDVEHQ